MDHAGILIASTSAGTGHVRAAEALREALTEREPALRIEHVDVLDLAPRWVRAAYGGGFELMAARVPTLWRELYRWTDGPDSDRPRWGPAAERLLFRAFHRLLTSADWRLCLCTHFLPCQLAAGRPGLPPFALVVTDFGLHRYWVQPGVRRYFTATETLASAIRQRAGDARIEARGIPIDPAFATAPTPAEARGTLGLGADRPVALIMGGGLGLGLEESVEAALAATPARVQLLAVCGRNEGAHARLASSGIPAERLRVFGYVQGIERYIAAADVVVTKPGGLTTSEALALGRPLILTRAIPGHEEENVRTLLNMGAALHAPDVKALQRALEQVYTRPTVLVRLGTAARRLGRPNAARSIAGAAWREYFLQLAA